MKAVILAGGLGTRLRPITYEIPKPLIPVRKKPIINHLIELFSRHGIEEVAVFINTSHREDFLRWKKAWENELSSSEISIFEEDRPRGTFGGMHLLKDWLNGETFLLSNGDELKDFDLKHLLNFHTNKKTIGTIALVSVPNPHEYGVPVLEGDMIQDFLEKPINPPSSYISSGLYILQPQVFNYADFNQEIVMIEKDIFPKLAKEGKLAGCKMEGWRWYDCGNLERWERAIKEW